MRVRFWGTRGSMPVALTAADVRDKLAQALVAADGRRFESFGAAYDFAQQELPFTLTHTFGGHSSCVELETGSNEYFVCDMGSGARPFGAHVLARAGGKVLIYSTDSEHKLENRGEAEAFVAFFRDADLVVFDAMYSLAEVASVKADWGHSSNIVGVELCQMAGVKHLVLFHHEPSSDDAAIEAVLRDTRRLEELTRGARSLRVSAAYDGLEIDL